VLFAFLDESYTRERYYIAAVVIAGDRLADLDAVIADVYSYATGFGVEGAPEVHGHRIMTGQDGWGAVRSKTRAALAIFARAIQGLAGTPARVFIRGVDVTRLNARYRYPSPPHEIVLQHLLEDLDEYARREGERVVVICDEVTGQARHRAMAERYQRSGTPGYKPSTLDAVLMPIRFADSREHAGLQLADLVAYLFRRLGAHAETHTKTRTAVLGLWQRLQPARQKVWRWDP
jgi:hypothetical protein